MNKIIAELIKFNCTAPQSDIGKPVTCLVHYHKVHQVLTRLMDL